MTSSEDISADAPMHAEFTTLYPTLCCSASGSFSSDPTGVSATRKSPRYNNKTSYYFDRELRTCKEVDFPVGILTPDWLANATYLGTDSVDTYDTHVWTKSEGFIKYWADVKTGLPVHLSPRLF